MPRPNPLRLSLLFLLLFVIACQNNQAIEFPPDNLPAIVGTKEAIHPSAEQPFLLSDSSPLKIPAAVPFDLNNITPGYFDSTDFLPFKNPPVERRFDPKSIASVDFDLDKIPGIAFTDTTMPILPGESIKIGRPKLKRGVESMIYDLGGILTDMQLVAVMEDRDGFVWIASDSKLYRYDGENLLAYLDIPAVVVLQQDKNGDIWACSTIKGIFRINPAANTVSLFQFPPEISQEKFFRMYVDDKGRIWAADEDKRMAYQIDLNKKLIKRIPGVQSPAGIFQDAAGRIWINQYRLGVVIIDEAAKKMQVLTKQDGLSDSLLSNAMPIQDAAGSVWISMENGLLNAVQLDSGRIRVYGPDQGLTIPTYIPSLTLDNKGHMWTGSSANLVSAKGIHVLDFIGQMSKKINARTGLNRNFVSRVYHSRDGAAWITTDAGLNMIQDETEYIRHAGHLDISTMAEDNNGRIWLGYLFDGLEILDPTTGKARRLTQNNGLVQNSVQYIVPDGNQTWIATIGNIQLLDESKKTSTIFGKEQGLSGTLNIFTKSADGRIWLGTDQMNGLLLYNAGLNSFFKLDSIHGLGAGGTGVVNCVYADKKNRVWIGSTSGGIQVIDLQKKSIRSLEGSPLLTKIAGSGYINSEDEAGNIWITTANDGAVMIKTTLDTVLKFEEGLISKRTTNVLTKGNKVYVATAAGLNVLTATAKSDTYSIAAFDRTTGFENLATSVISDMVRSNGEFWWGDRGVTVLDEGMEKQKKTKPETYISALQVMGKQINFQTVTADQHSYLSWDSLKGLYSMPTGLKLDHDHNNLQFQFLQKDPTGLEKDTISYRYVLEGLDKTWSESTDRSFSQTYQNLSPGKYTFKVSSRFQREWSEPQAFSFTIAPPWWKTWWAYLLYLLLASYLVWGFVRYRSRQLQKENQRLEKTVALRTSQLSQSIDELKAAQRQLIESEKMASLGELTAGIAHEIQNPLNFVNNFSEINVEMGKEFMDEIKTLSLPDEQKTALSASLHDMVTNQEKIEFHGKRASAIVKSMLLHSRNSNGDKEPTDINVLADEYLRLSYHGLRAKEKNFQAKLVTDLDPQAGKINIVSQDVGRVLLNLLNNAYFAVSEKAAAGIPGYQPTVWLSTHRSNGTVSISVRDNGNGIPEKAMSKIFQPFFTTKAAGQGTGLGLSLSYDIITNAHKGTLNAETKPGEGTTFVVELPAAVG